MICIVVYIAINVNTLLPYYTILLDIYLKYILYTIRYTQGDVAIVTSTVEYANISTGLYNKIKKAGKKGNTVTYLPFFSTNIFVRPPGTDT